jgi:peptidyl-prolyl cis-trans isomerase D
MLHFLRRHSQSKVIQVIFSLIIAVFVLWGVGAVVNEGSPLTMIASVDGKPIEQLSVQRAEMNLAQAYREAYKNQFTPEMRKAMNLRQRALDGLIDRAVLVNQAHQLGYGVDDQALRDSIVDSPAFQVGGRFNKEHYLRVLRSAGLTPGDFESAKREDLAVERLQNVIGDNVTVSDADARDDVLLQEEKRSIAFVKIPAAELSAQVQVSDADLEKFYEDNKARYAEPAKVKVELLSYPPDKFQDGIEVTEEQITTYYDENVSSKYTQQHEVHARHILFRVPRDADDAARAKALASATDVKKKIDAGGDFVALVKEFSEDPGTKDKGGDLGFFPRGRMVGEFDEAVFALNAGEVSEIVETPYGFHIIKVEEVREERQKPLDEVREEVVTAIKKESATDKAKAAADQDEQALGGGATLDQIAEKRGLTVEKPEALPRNAAFPTLGRSLPLTNALWDAKPGAYTAPVDVNGTLVIGKVVENVASTTPPFAEVKDRVDAAYRLQKATELAKTEAEKVLAAAQKDGLDKAATASNRKSEVASAFTRSGPFIPGLGSNQEVKDVTFALTQDKKLGDKVYVIGPDAYVVELRDVVLPSDEDIKTKIADTKKRLLEKRRNDAFSRYLGELKKKAHIEVNADRLEAIPSV